MTEGVTYKLSIQDYMSGALQKLRNTARVVFNGVNTDVRKTAGQLDMTGRSAATLERYMKMLERRRKISIDDSEITSLNRKLQQVEGRLSSIKTLGRSVTPSVGGSSGGGFGMASLGLTRLGGMAAAIGLTAATVGALGNSAQAGLMGQAQRTSYETIAGVEPGGRLYGDVTKFAQQSIYGNELYSQAQMQLAYGANANEVMPTLRMLGDVAMGDKQRMEGLNLAYSQTRATGKLQGQDLIQFVTAGFNPLQEIAQKTGRKYNDLREDMSKGLITFDMVREAFTSATEPGGKFYKMVDRIAQTDYGKKEAARGQLQGLGLQLGGAMAPLIGKFVDQIGVPGMNFMSNEVIPKLGNFMEGLSDYMPTIKELFGATYQTVKPILGLLASDGVKNLLLESGNLAVSMATTLKPAVEDLAWVMNAAVKVLKPVVGLANTTVKSVHGDLDLAGAAAGADRVIARQRQEIAADFKAVNMRLSGQKPTMSIGELLDPRKMLTRGKAFPTMVNTALPPPPGTAGNALATMVAGTGTSASGGTDAITGGGRKVVNVHFHKEVVAANGININVSGTARDGADEAARILRQELNMIGHSIGGAYGG